MKKYLLFLWVGIFCSPLRGLSQSKDSFNKITDCPKPVLGGYPCDSLYKIKGLKNVQCGNYAVLRHDDMAAFTECITQKLNESRLTKKEQEILEENQKERK